ncbi:DUF134 domain-containing protein [Grimontia hollisae]|uniref:UPF0251 protein NCTC11645_03403 n=1 Tax=Grimontia hollisae TaxID=673 RepID=A0A377J7R9_GRIHO|nr:DUF134 domain-containing protein [Grimontia hollisae]MDF2184684.1 DUF134 domain-containing protein [Grimontia hollisae]STO98418.1 RNA polymerase sigma factor, SigZ family [Grimontia hollisae]STQ75758.1 RNA polymerase sigma factor, SigZ family [Grimontia hollisae]
MARPKKERNICRRAPYECFKPNGVPLSQLDKVELLDEELEALRLADLEDLSQADAAASMGISRQTFGNIVKRARAKVAQSLVHGQALIFSREP